MDGAKEIKNMKKKIVIGLIAVVAIVAVVMFAGCVEKPKEIPSEEEITGLVRQTPTVIKEEKIGGKYNASVLTVHREYKGKEHTWYQIEYTKNNKTIRFDFNNDSRGALEWIKLNTSEDAVIMCWWDYGHSIRGYTGREVVIDFASKEMLRTVGSYKYESPEQKKETEAQCIPHERITDVARVLTTENPEETVEIMRKYNATHLFIHKSDVHKSDCFFFALGEEAIDTKTEDFGRITIGKAMQGAEINGFKLVYFDDIMKIYKLET